MILKRNEWLLIGALILLAALPTLAQSNIAWLGINQDSDETSLEELSLENIEMIRIAADGPAESAVINAPQPFNAVVAQWTPIDDPFFWLEIRTGQEGAWGEWQPLEASLDMTEEGDDFVTSSMIFVYGDALTHDEVQLRSGTIAVVENVRLTFIDSTQGPTTDELVASMDAIRASESSRSAFDTEAILANPKPNIISRDVWCTSDLCRPNEGDSGNGCVNADPLNYIDVTHLVVHHTVTSNDALEWAAVVRAIWSFHAFSRCWGDIGYNYLIDPHGNIYEGHRGGDNIAGTHASYINGDSMGVSLLGTFTDPGPPYYGVKPPAPMVDSLVDILAWKADQKKIDPWDSAEAKSLGSGRPNLMGHRDAHGTTRCPGDQAHGMLPEVRQRVAERLDFVATRLYVDELSSDFDRNNANWHTGTYSCGFNGNAWFTLSTSDSNVSANVGEWTLKVPADGIYVVEAMVPFCNTGNSETSSADYRIEHVNGTSNVVIDQNANVGLWAKIGNYEFAAGENYILRLTDVTDDNGRGVWFDAIRLTPATDEELPDPQFSLNAPEDNAWLNDQTVDFEWSIDDFFGPQQIVLRLSTTVDMQSEISSQTLSSGLTASTVVLDHDYPEIYWQVEALGTNNGVSEVKRLGIDTAAPSTTVQMVLKQENGPFYISLAGSDGEGIGISHYAVEYRVAGSGNSWVGLQDNINSNVVRFVPSDGAVYEFRVAGTDYVGNVELFEDVATGSTADAIIIRPAAFLPLIAK
ncbi:MAG: hypothetical protein ACI85U_001617 [Candidatus Promineifilaceae bacterium]